jgi:transcription elongation factor Elf1
VASASDRLTHFKECLEYDEYSYISGSGKLKQVEQKLNGLLFDCPRCTKHGVRVTVDRDLFTDNYFIRADCRYCGAYNSIQISSFALQRVKEMDIMMVAAIKGTISSLKQDTKDLDAMIDEDWKLAGSQ